MCSPATQQPTPQLFFQTINSYQRTEALKAAIELEVFTAIGEGNSAVPEIAKRCQTSERGMRILCDYLCIMGFLAKDGGRYSLTQDSAVFLDKRSPAYLGGAIEFLLSPMLTDGFKDLAAAVRKGGAVISEEGVVAPEHPIWVKFARAMAPMMAMPSQLMAKLVDEKADRNLKILDIARPWFVRNRLCEKQSTGGDRRVGLGARVGSRERERAQRRGQRSLQYD